MLSGIGLTSPLSFAVSSSMLYADDPRTLRIVSQLLAAGANPNERWDGRCTPLMGQQSLARSGS